MRQVAASLAQALGLIITMPTNAKGAKLQKQEAIEFIEQALYYLKNECALKDNEVETALNSIKLALESLETFSKIR